MRLCPTATVTLTNTATGVSMTKTTNAEGNYEFFTVSAGLYLMTVEKAGFAMAMVENITVQVGSRMRVDAQMNVGQVSERIQVTGTAPLIETDTSARGQIITGDQTRALPLNGREYSSLALLTTGVRLSALNNNQAGTPREGAFNVNGLRSTFNNFLIDGVDNNAYGTSNQGFSNQVMQPAPDAISEFKVVTNNMSAEYGRAAGATINVAYRSGGNQFHGNAWEFLRDTKMNAEGFFKPATGKPTLSRHQYGGTLGGPIVRNKAFFFGDFEGFRQDRKITTISSIPTPTQRQGILARRRARSAHRRRVSGGHAHPDDGVCVESALAAARHDVRGQHEQLHGASAVHESHRQGRRQGRHAAERSRVGVRAVWLARLEYGGSAARPAARGRRRQRHHLRAEQAARAGQHVRARQCIAPGSAIRLVANKGGQESSGARLDERA